MCISIWYVHAGMGNNTYCSKKFIGTTHHFYFPTMHILAPPKCAMRHYGIPKDQRSGQDGRAGFCTRKRRRHPWTRYRFSLLEMAVHVALDPGIFGIFSWLKMKCKRRMLWDTSTDIVTTLHKHCIANINGTHGFIFISILSFMHVKTTIIAAVLDIESSIPHDPYTCTQATTCHCGCTGHLEAITKI